MDLPTPYPGGGVWELHGQVLQKADVYDQRQTLYASQLGISSDFEPIFFLMVKKKKNAVVKMIQTAL